MSRVDVLVVSLDATAGLREADEELVASMRRARRERRPRRGGAPADGAHVRPDRFPVGARGPAGGRRGPERAGDRLLELHRRAALATPRGRALRRTRRRQPSGAPRRLAASGRAAAAGAGVPDRPLERAGARRGAASARVRGGGAGGGRAVRPVRPRDIAAVTYAADPAKKGLDRVLSAWGTARREGEELLVAGMTREEAPLHVGEAAVRTPGVRFVGPLPRNEYRALLRRAHVFVTAPRREDHGLAQLEALADGAQLVTAPAPGPYVALGMARALDPRLVTGDLATGLREALDAPGPATATPRWTCSHRCVATQSTPWWTSVYSRPCSRRSTGALVEVPHEVSVEPRELTRRKLAHDTVVHGRLREALPRVLDARVAERRAPVRVRPQLAERRRPVGDVERVDARLLADDVREAADAGAEHRHAHRTRLKGRVRAGLAPSRGQERHGGARVLAGEALAVQAAEQLDRPGWRRGRARECAAPPARPRDPQRHAGGDGGRDSGVGALLLHQRPANSA